MAERLGVKIAAIGNWKLRDSIPVEYCADIETMTGRKFDISDSPPTAYCAGWPRVEKEGARRRPLFEPFINDNFRRNVDGAQDDLERMHQSSAARIREQSARRRFAGCHDCGCR